MFTGILSKTMAQKSCLLRINLLTSSIWTFAGPDDVRKTVKMRKNIFFEKQFPGTSFYKTREEDYAGISMGR